ncbi:MAG: hypothetical protein LUC97_02225 [Clostridiales bacterium]|nr:hypothetical protein [Clostridiales bacterium]
MSLWENIKRFFAKTNGESETALKPEEAEEKHDSEVKVKVEPTAEIASDTENKIEGNTNNPQNDVDTFIKFCVAEDREKRIALGKRQDNYFICFKNEALSGFLFDWYGIMKSRINNEMQEDLYVQFLDTICKKYINENTTDVAKSVEK